MHTTHVFCSYLYSREIGLLNVYIDIVYELIGILPLSYLKLIVELSFPKKLDLLEG